MIEKYKKIFDSSITVQRLLSFKEKLKPQKVRDGVKGKKNWIKDSSCNFVDPESDIFKISWHYHQKNKERNTKMSDC